MAFCLPPIKTKELLKALRDGTITPEKLSSFENSATRREFLGKIVGKENAVEVNTIIESKMLLKDFKTGLVSGIKKMTGMTPEVKQDLITKVEKMEKILNPADEKAFLEDIASKRLGVEIDFKQAQKITELSKAIQEAKLDISTHEKRVAYGEKILDLMDYVESIKPLDKNLVENIINIPKTVMSTLDFSAPLNQGWGSLSTKEFYTSLIPMFKYAFSPKAYRRLQAEIISDPLYASAKKGGLRLSAVSDRISQREESYMSNLLGKIPVIGHLVKGSERAYVGFLNKLRFDSFKNLVRSAEMAGEDVGTSSHVLRDLANVVNDFTGSGNLGTGDKYANAVPILNAGFFSPRKISATVNMLNPERYLNPKISPTAKKAALRRLLGSIAITTTIVGLAKMAGADVETDPRSSDFGVIKDGKTRFGFTGGNKTYANLIARLITNSTKTSKGKIREFGEGYKPDNRLSITAKFARNKLAPFASFVADWLAGSNAIGEKFEPGKAALDRVTSFTVQNVIELYKEDPDNAMWGALLSIFGGEVQTY